MFSTTTASCIMILVMFASRQVVSQSYQSLIDLSIEEQFSRGVCQKLRQDYDFPSNLQFKRPLVTNCICNRITVPCVKVFECAEADISNDKVAFVFAHDLHNADNHTEKLPIEQAKLLRNFHPNYDVIFLVPEYVEVQQQMFVAADKEDIEVLQIPLPKLSEDVEQYSRKFRDLGRNCCGEEEFLKFHVFKMFDYDVVFSMDHDIRVVRPLDRVIRCMNKFDFLATKGHSAPTNGGIFMVRPNRAMHKLLADFLATSTYQPKQFWNKVNTDKSEGYGAESVQGALYDFFYMHDPYLFNLTKKHDVQLPVAGMVDRCVYNFIFKHDPKCYRIAPTIVHKNYKALTKIQWMTDKNSDEEIV